MYDEYTHLFSKLYIAVDVMFSLYQYKILDNVITEWYYERTRFINEIRKGIRWNQVINNADMIIQDSTDNAIT